MPQIRTPRRRAALLFTTVLLAGPSLPLAAQTSHPLWQQTRQHLARLGGLVAGQVEYRISQQGAGRRAQYRAVEQLAGWDGSQPQRRWVASADSPMQGLAEVRPPADFNPADHPERVLLDIDTVEPAGVELRGAVPAQVFDIQGHLEAQESLAGSQQARRVGFRGQVWVEQDGGAPLRLDYQLDGLPFTQEFRYQVDFAPDVRNHRQVPVQARLTVTTRLPLVGSSTVQRQLQFSDWQERPQ